MAGNETTQTLPVPENEILARLFEEAIQAKMVP